jgi:hypothetical protein
MTADLVAQTVAEIAERERRAAVEHGDYVWALVCAFIENQARLAGEGVT